MIHGMTGFGSAQLSTGKVKAIVEIKSLNHRYFDLSFFLPIGFASVENKVRQMVQKDILRGRVTLSMKITSKPLAKVLMNEDFVKEYLHFARLLKRHFGLENDLTISDIVRLPGVMETREEWVSPEDMWPSLEKCISKSLKDLMKMRRMEGRSLIADLSDKLKHMDAQIRRIKARARALLREKRKNFSQEEFSSYQRSSDVNEEISRLSHYVDEMKKLLRTPGSVGKKIDFVAQEMQRETNTVGSKLQDKIISNAVITLKSKIEKIREQAQNVE